MKLEKTTSGVKKITMSKAEWLNIGKQAGWISRKASMTATVNYEIVYLGDPWDATVSIVVTKVGNDGIGPYEFWGARGFDKGSNYVEEFEIENIEIPGLELSAEDEARIINDLKNNEAFAERVRESVDVDELARDSYEPDYEPDYPED